MKTKAELRSFFDHELPLLLDKLSADEQPLWGTMDAQRMIEHLGLGVKLANGKITLPASVIDARAAKFKTIGLLSDRPLQKDFNNPALPQGLQPYAHGSLSEAKEQLSMELQAMYAYFEEHGPTATRVHNIFGELNGDEWLWFQYKHFMHHFMQFSVVPASERIS